MRRDVEFATEDGTVLRGFFHASPSPPAPGIVMTHGFSGVKEQIDHYAASFAEAGFSVLVYDHRGFGTSEGAPRQEVDPLRQMADWRDAMTFTEALPEVDESRGLGLWGSSFAGGLAMVLAANDERVRCVVAQIPNVSGHRNGRELFTAAQRAELGKRSRLDRAARLAGEEPATMPVFAPDGLAALPVAVSARYVEAVIAATPTWRNEVTLRSVEQMVEFEPAGWVPHVAPTPLMMIVAAEDNCTPPEIQLEVFSSAREPKRLVIHPGGHFETYTTHFEKTSAAAREWFAQHMSPVAVA